ncbi:MAG: N-acetyltransferase [Sphingobacteriales bacterium]|nr:MAG: N-acetyltransferase [Sphingobacteriales bacterium]
MEEQVFIHESAIVDAGAAIGSGSKIWHFTHIMPAAKIGAHCIIGQNCFIANHVLLGNGVKVQNNVSLYEGVICGDFVFIGPSVVFTNVMNPRAAIERKDQYKVTKIATGASIGANATIICGNSIGAYALIGAGSVITKDVPDYALVYGNPAIQKGWVSRAGYTLTFDGDKAICKETGEMYRLAEGKVKLMK